MKTPKARLDADRTAKSKTRLIEKRHVDDQRCLVSDSATHIEHEDGSRTALHECRSSTDAANNCAHSDAPETVQSAMDCSFYDAGREQGRKEGIAAVIAVLKRAGPFFPESAVARGLESPDGQHAIAEELKKLVRE